MWDVNDVNVSPGSSTSPTSDPGRETVFTEVPRQGPATGSSNRVLRVFEKASNMDHWSILLAYSAYPVILAALAPRIRFYLHKEFRDREIRLYLHKEFRAAEIGFSLHKEFFIRKSWKINGMFQNIFRAAPANLLRISWEKSWKMNGIFENFTRCAR